MGLRRVTFLCVAKEKSPKERRPGSLRRPIAKEEARWAGALRSSLVAGSIDRPSLACRWTLRHPCLARREHTRRLLPPQAPVLGAAIRDQSQKPKQQQTLTSEPLRGS